MPTITISSMFIIVIFCLYTSTYIYIHVTNAFFIFNVEKNNRHTNLQGGTSQRLRHKYTSEYFVHCYGWEGAEGRRWTGMCTVHTSLWPLEYIGSFSHRGFESLVRYFILSSVKQAAVSSSLISSPGISSGQHHVSPTSTRPEHMVKQQAVQ